MNALVQAILAGCPSKVRMLVKQDPSLLKASSSSGSTMLELARNKGISEIVVILLRENSPGTASFEDYENLLEGLVMEISESWTMTSWYSGIEFIIWSLVIGDRESYSFSEYHYPFSLAPEERAEWLFLVKQARGWPTGEGFLPLEEWEELYRAHRTS